MLATHRIRWTKYLATDQSAVAQFCTVTSARLIGARLHDECREGKFQQSVLASSFIAPCPCDTRTGSNSTSFLILSTSNCLLVKFSFYFKYRREPSPEPALGCKVYGTFLRPVPRGECV